MNIVDRWKQICDLVSDTDYMTVDELVEKVGASPATIRRDLKSLEEEGRLQRFRGGVKPIQNSYVGAFGIDRRLLECTEEKQRISRKAASLVEEGDYIYLDTSSTAYFLIDYLTVTDVSVVTNSIMLLPKLLKRKIPTYVFGGNIHFESGSIIGEDIMERVKAMNFNKVFLGAYGIDLESGFTTYDTTEGQMKKQLIEQSKTTYILADSRKFGVHAFYTFGTLKSATVITEFLPMEFSGLNNVILA